MSPRRRRHNRQARKQAAQVREATAKFCEVANRLFSTDTFWGMVQDGLCRVSVGDRQVLLAPGSLAKLKEQQRKQRTGEP